MRKIKHDGSHGGKGKGLADRTLTKVKREMAQMSLVGYVVALCEEQVKRVKTMLLYTENAHDDLRAGNQSFRHR